MAYIQYFKESFTIKAKKEIKNIPTENNGEEYNGFNTYKRYPSVWNFAVLYAQSLAKKDRKTVYVIPSNKQGFPIWAIADESNRDTFIPFGQEGFIVEANGKVFEAKVDRKAIKKQDNNEKYASSFSDYENKGKYLSKVVKGHEIRLNLNSRTPEITIWEKGKEIFDTAMKTFDIGKTVDTLKTIEGNIEKM